MGFELGWTRLGLGLGYLGTGGLGPGLDNVQKCSKTYWLVAFTKPNELCDEDTASFGMNQRDHESLSKPTPLDM